jgi:hypothetical protein
MGGTATVMCEAEAVSMLTACRDLFARIEASGQGIYYEPLAEDQPIIKGWAMVHRMVEQHTLRLPGVAERRIEEPRRYFGPERG